MAYIFSKLFYKKPNKRVMPIPLCKKIIRFLKKVNIFFFLSVDSLDILKLE